jgi:hypothetical protein
MGVIQRLLSKSGKAHGVFIIGHVLLGHLSMATVLFLRAMVKISILFIYFPSFNLEYKRWESEALKSGEERMNSKNF